MPRRKSPEAPPEAPPPEPAEPTVKLRLRQNHFVRGQFTPAGTVVAFTPQEAERRLTRTQLWDRA